MTRPSSSLSLSSSSSFNSLTVFVIAAVVIITGPDVARSFTVEVEPKSEPVWYMEGAPFSMRCIVLGKIEENPMWSMDELPLRPDWDTQMKIDTSGPKDKTVLTMMKERATEDDSGTFRCSVGTQDVVKQVGMFTVNSRDVNLTRGFQTTISCDIEPFYHEIAILWYKGKTPLEKIPELEDRFSFGQFNKTVSILNSKTSDTGIYTCILKFNPKTDMEQSFTANVGIMGKPHIVPRGSPLGHLKNVTNTSIILTCPATGYPTPEVFWLRGDDVIEASSKYLLSSVNGIADTKLEVKTPTDGDFGRYICVAENSMGKAQIALDLKTQRNNGAGEIALSRLSIGVVGAGFLLLKSSLL